MSFFAYPLIYLYVICPIQVEAIPKILLKIYEKSIEYFISMPNAKIVFTTTICHMYTPYEISYFILIFLNLYANDIPKSPIVIPCNGAT